MHDNNFKMDETGNDFFAESKKELEQYLQDRIWLLKLQAGEKSARLIAVLFSVLLILVLAFFVLFFFSIMGGFYFSALAGNFYIGFGVIAGFYVLLLVLFILFRNRIRKIIIDQLIRIFFTKSGGEDGKN